MEASLLTPAHPALRVHRFFTIYFHNNSLLNLLNILYYMYLIKVKPIPENRKENNVVYISTSDYEFLKRLKFKLLEIPNNGIASYYFNLHEIVSKLDQQRTNQIENEKKNTKIERQK